MTDGIVTLDDVSVGQITGQLLVCRDGYEIRGDLEPVGEGYKPSGPWIVPKSSVGQVFSVMTSPCRQLHRKFAKLASRKRGLNGEAILRFVSQYGLLNDANPNAKTTQNLVYSLRADRIRYSHLMINVNGEQLFKWIERINEAAALIALWDLIREERRDELARYIRWESPAGRLSIYFGFDGRRLTTDPSFNQRYRTVTWSDGSGESEWDAIADPQESDGEYFFAVFPELRGPKPDLVRAGRLYLYRLINQRLACNISAELDMQREPARALVFHPLNLTGAIYLHFTREVMGHDPAWERCANPDCNVNFPPRSNKIYCSDGCRNSIWYKTRGRSRYLPEHTTPHKRLAGQRGREISESLKH